jgi:hypothetical protein
MPIFGSVFSVSRPGWTVHWAHPGWSRWRAVPDDALARCRAALVATGVIGTPTQVQVSSTQQYHVIALIRGLLGAGRGRFRSGLAG